MSITSNNVDNLAILTYLQKIDKKISNLEYDLNDLKERMYEDDSPSSSTVDVDQSWLDIEEKNFDNVWILKHYKVDCPEFDQPLSMESLHNLGCDMTPEQYGKYVATFDNLDDKEVEAL